MAGVLANARGNGVEVEELDSAALRAMEPNIAGLAGLFVRETGIVDYKLVCARLADRFRAAGGEVALDAKVDAISERDGTVHVAAGPRSWQAKFLIACAGLQSDRLARLSGLAIEHRIIPFRGEYFLIRPEKSRIVHKLIYPVPDPDLPFLGVHLTPMISGSLTVGPNAVLSFAREKYAPFAVDTADVSDYLSFPGFWRVMGQHWKTGMAEMWGSISKAAYLEECRKYCPSLELDDLLPYGAGIRAQAVARDGTLIHDFVFLQTERMLHVCNAPSPAATSALPIAELIADKVVGKTRS
jgi:L-2-hydroxyglutarate oxidase